MKADKCNKCHIKCVAARNLDTTQIAVMEHNSAQVTFKKGEIIFKQDALSLNVAFLKEGLAKIHMHGPAHEKIIKIVKAPCYLGIPTTIGDKINQYSATALLDNTTACFIDVNLFRNFIISNGAFAYEIILDLCQNELSDYQRYVNQSQKQVPGLVAETLVCLAEKIFESNSFSLPLTRSELGDLVGASRENISRVLTDFSNAGIIRINAKEIEILDLKKLEAIRQKG